MWGVRSDVGIFVPVWTEAHSGALCGFGGKSRFDPCFPGLSDASLPILAPLAPVTMFVRCLRQDLRCLWGCYDACLLDFDRN